MTSEFDSRSEAFLNWFRSLPGATFSDSIKLADLRAQGAGRGIVATKDIEPDTTLFTIPRKNIINIQTSDLTSKLGAILDLDAVPENGTPQQDSWSSLILILLHEHLRGDQSPWKSYLDVLPDSFETPMFWSQGELDELQASPLRGKIGRGEAETMFRSSVLPVIRRHPEHFAGSEGISDDNLIGLAHRMGSIIMAYAFDLENEDDDEEGEGGDGWVEDRDGKALMGMVPMADILNADAEFNAHINHGDDSLTATALRPIKAGEEIFNYYGPHPNSELLRRYGYVTERHSRYDVVEVPWTAVQQAIKEVTSLSDEHMQRITKHLEDEEELEDTFVLEREAGEPNPDGTFPGPAKLTGIPGELADQLKTVLKLVKKISPESLPEKRKRDDVLTSIVFRVVALQQAQYGTTIAEDERILAEVPADQRRRRMAVEVRLGEKRLLEEAAALFQACLANGDDDGLGKRAKHSE